MMWMPKWGRRLFAGLFALAWGLIFAWSLLIGEVDSMALGLVAIGFVVGGGFEVWQGWRMRPAHREW